MKKYGISLLFLVAVSSCSTASAASPGHRECEKQFKQLSNGLVLTVPEVQDWGDKREYYFAWNDGSKSSLIKTTGGYTSGSCTINKATGEGFVTLNNKDLGKFKASLSK